jgi:hypothetical protein
MKPAAVAAACLALALLTFFQFPGHTWLQQDSQIYVPILERLENPAALRNDLLTARPHVAYTLYDEAALALRAVTRLDFRRVLELEQIAARAFGIWGLYLCALSLLRRRAGFQPAMPASSPAFLPHLMALFIAAICSLGAVVAGPTVLTVEYEPTPRAFALPLVICAVGLVAHRRYLAAGIAGAAAFLLHAPTALPFWGLYLLLFIPHRRAGLRPAMPASLRAFLSANRRVLWGLFPLALAIPILILAAHRQQVPGEAQQLFARITPFREQVQRLRASYNWISTWPRELIPHYAIAFAVLLAAYARLRRDIGPELRLFLLGLPALGILSMPASFLLLERARWALIPELQPMRCLLFVTLFMVLLAASAGVRAAVARRPFEAVAWFALAYLPALQPVFTQSYAVRTLAVTMGLAALAWLAIRLSGRRAGVSLALGLAAFFAIPGIGGVVNYPASHNPELAQLSAWARASTPPDAVFLFADAGRSGDSGIFRAEAVRAIYVDWKGGGQVNYLPGFAEEWWFRWQQTNANRFRPSILPKYESLGIQYVVLQPRNRLPDAPVFENAKYAVHALASAGSR